MHQPTMRKTWDKEVPAIQWKSNQHWLLSHLPVFMHIKIWKRNVISETKKKKLPEAVLDSCKKSVSEHLMDEA